MTRYVTHIYKYIGISLLSLSWEISQLRKDDNEFSFAYRDI